MKEIANRMKLLPQFEKIPAFLILNAQGIEAESPQKSPRDFEDLQRKARFFHPSGEKMRPYLLDSR